MNRWLWVMGLGFSLVGCQDHLFGQPIGDTGGSSAVFPAEISAVWDSHSCTNAGCHGGGASSAGVALEAGDCESVAAGAAVVVGDAAGSALWLEVDTEDMPLSGDPLTQEEKDQVAAWINDGAVCDPN